MTMPPQVVSTPAAGGRPDIDVRVVAAAGALLLAGTALLGDHIGWRHAALFGIGGALGLVLYHAAFGFTSAWRRFIAVRRGGGLRAQMLMLAVAVALFYPALAEGTLFGRPVYGFVAPAGTSVLVGAFLFGIGMQLGGGCASGTLYTVGGGSTRMVITLAAFIAGSLIATAHLHWWLALPAPSPISVIGMFGLAPALTGTLAVLAAIALASWWLERRRHGIAPAFGDRLDGAPVDGMPSWRRRMLQGPWPLVWGAVGLALLNFATLAVAGRPWGITSAFALWGGQIATTAGLDITDWPYWVPRQGALEASVFRDTTSVMNFGLVLGALLAAGLAGRFAPVWRLPGRTVAAAVIGGLMLGYGARLAFGCNIGAYFSGVASGSLHGWLWLVAGFAGNVVGTRLRPAFGLTLERTPA